MPKMPKIIIFVLAAALFFAPGSVGAEVIINEIMYDLSGTDTDHEWVEIYNNGASGVDISGWKFYDGSNHNLNVPQAQGGQGAMLLSASGYAILSADAATFLADHPGFSGTVIDTVLSLNNTGATVKILKSDSSVSDSVTYVSAGGASGDGNSLQLLSGAWIAAAPTPGAENQGTVANSNPSGEPVRVEGGGASPAPSAQTAGVKTYSVKIISPKTSLAGLPLPLQAEVYEPGGGRIYAGRLFWNFGDGDSREVKENIGAALVHAYFYPGQYDISVEYYRDYFSDAPTARARQEIKIAPMAIVISRLGGAGDFFVELANNSGAEADISKWSLVQGEKAFFLPRNTFLPAGGKIILSPKITGFDFALGQEIQLLTKEGIIAHEHTEAPVKTVTVQKKSQNEPLAKPMALLSTPAPAEESIESNTDLTATASSSNLTPEDTAQISYWPLWGAGALVLFGAGGVYVLRKRKGVSGGDFELLDE